MGIHVRGLGAGAQGGDAFQTDLLNIVFASDQWKMHINRSLSARFLDQIRPVRAFEQVNFNGVAAQQISGLWRIIQREFQWDTPSMSSRAFYAGMCGYDRGKFQALRATNCWRA